MAGAAPAGESYDLGLAVREGDLPDSAGAFLQVSLVITVLATLLAAALGLIMAVIRYSKVPVLSPATSGFLQFIRAADPGPAFFVYYVLPDIGVLITAIDHRRARAGRPLRELLC